MLPLSPPPQSACYLNCHAALSSGRAASVCPSISHPVCFLPHIHGTNQYCDTLIRLKALRECSLVEPSSARQMISQGSVNAHSDFATSSLFSMILKFTLSSSCLVFQYNSVNMKNKTAEEVYVEMLKPAETVTLKVQHRPDDFSMLKDVPGDGFYIRYMHKCTWIILSGVNVIQLCKGSALIFPMQPHLCPCCCYI